MPDFTVTTTVGKWKRRFLCSQMFQARYDEPFVFDFQIKDDKFSVTFTQETDKNEKGLCIKSHKPQDSTAFQVALVNFAGGSWVLTEVIPFFNRDGKTYSLQMLITSGSGMLDKDLPWFYLVSFYEEELHDWREQ